MNHQLRKMEPPNQPNTTQQNNSEQTLTREQKLIKRNLKRILNSEKTTLPSLRNIERRIVKTETNNVNQVLTCISTNNITKLKQLIYAGAKLVCEKIGIPSKITKEKSKPEWEFRLETQIKNLRKQLKVIKQKKNAGINRNRKKDSIGKTYNTTWGNIPESSGKRRKIEEISTKGKAIQTK